MLMEFLEAERMEANEKSSPSAGSLSQYTIKPKRVQSPQRLLVKRCGHTLEAEELGGDTGGVWSSANPGAPFLSRLQNAFLST